MFEGMDLKCGVVNQTTHKRTHPHVHHILRWLDRQCRCAVSWDATAPSPSRPKRWAAAARASMTMPER